MKKIKVNWISILDKLPPDGEEVITLNDKGKISQCDCLSTYIKIGNYSNVTHWIPMLELPPIKCYCYHEYEEQRPVYDKFSGELAGHYTTKVGCCWGTRERDVCSCGGDKNKCNFYKNK